MLELEGLPPRATPKGATWRRHCTLLALACTLLCAPLAHADEPMVHVVYKGQRLGSIAKRYNVSVDSLCAANGITRKDPIRPGQKLIIPGKTAPAKSEQRKVKRRTAGERRKNPKPPGKHTVQSGQRLGSIAKRYGTSVDAICHANGITRRTRIHPGDVLLIPGKGDTDGSYAAQLRSKGQVKSKAVRRTEKRTSTRRRSDESWRKYKKAAWKRGYVHLVGFNDTWKGYVIDPKGRVIPNARQKISKVLSATGERPRINRRLIQLIAKVSDTFGGRPMRIVSGYRERSYSAASRHKTGRALDFSIPGVPNEALRDYVRTFSSVGVGYYPNSTFVHLDVRDKDTYWIDYSGPGEPPRRNPRRKTGTTPGEGPRDHEQSTPSPIEPRRETAATSPAS